ncbi:MAG: hypothetical protein WDN01_09550 [Rhizomicrobium sp.]
MKSAYAVFACLLAVAPAIAAPPPKGPICIDPKWDYQARWLSGNVIVAKQTLGHDHRELKLSTTCIALREYDYFRLASDFHCVGMGDHIVADKVGGRSQSCRISHVEPYVPAPAATRN